MEQNMKECFKCKQSKSLADFYKSSNQKDGYDYYCKYCRVGTAIKSHKGIAKKKCTVSECEMKHYAKGMCRNHYTRWNRNGQLEHVKKTVIDSKTYVYKSQTINYKREYYIRSKYNILYSEFLAMAQKGCNVCGEFTERHLQVDHDHNCCNKPSSCGKCVRGVVCNRCNQTIGKLEQNKIRADHPLIEKVKEYVYGKKRQTSEV